MKAAGHSWNCRVSYAYATTCGRYRAKVPIYEQVLLSCSKLANLAYNKQEARIA